MESRLVLNNKGPQPIEVQPTLFSKNGAILQVSPITVERNSHQTVNLSDWANMGGEEFKEGNVRLFHRGKDLVLGTQIQIIDNNNSLIFENKLSELGKFDSRRLEGVWWIPNNNTDSTIVLTNTGDEFLTVTATLTRKPHISGSPHTFNLLQHETKVLNVRNDFNQGDVFAKSNVLGLLLTHNGSEDALLAWTMIKDESKGYSNIAKFTNPAKSKSNQYHGAGLQLGAFGNDELEPIVVLSNTTDSRIDVNIKVPYTKNDGTSDIVSVNTVKLKPREVHQVNMQRVINLPNVRTAGIEIEYTGNMGSITASVQSVSQSRNQVFQTLLWDPPALKSAASLYPFYIYGTSSTKAYIKNAGFKEENYVSHITWGNDGEYIIPVSKIRKGETVEIDVKKLRDEQIPDEQGRTIPLNISKGQIHWSLRRGEATVEESLANKVPLVGQATQIDTIKGISYSYFCLNCCEYGAYSFATIVPGNGQVNHPAGVQYQVLENGIDCYGNTISGRNITVLAYDWQSTNTNIATVNNSGYVTTVGGGQTQIKAKVQLPVNYFYSPGCPGGGPYFAAKEKYIEIGDEIPLSSKEKEDSWEFLFSNISFKDAPKQPVALIPDQCDCLTFTKVENLSASLTVNQLIIKRDGNPITASNNTVIVGQKMTLTAEVLPSGTSVTNRSWTLPPTVVKDFVVSPTTGGSVAVDGLNTASVSFAWVDGGGTNPDDSAAKIVQFTANTSGGQLSGNATFNVKRPVVTATTSVSTTNFLITPNNYKLIFGNSNTDGITFSRSITFPTNYTGTTQWVQIANQSIRNGVVNGVTQISQNPPSGLDGCYPYTTVNSLSAFDSPFIELSGGTVQRTDTVSLVTNDNYTMWLMFKPFAAEAIWVPLKKVNWFWNAQATHDLSGWNYSGNSPTTNPVFGDTTDFPTWTSVIADPNNPCPP